MTLSGAGDCGSGGRTYLRRSELRLPWAFTSSAVARASPFRRDAAPLGKTAGKRKERMLQFDRVYSLAQRESAPCFGKG